MNAPDVLCQIYGDRLNIGKQRQRHFARTLDELDLILNQLNRLHPYRRDEELYERFMQVKPFYLPDRRWLPARPPEPVLYHIDNLKKLFLYSKKNTVRQDGGFGNVTLYSDIATVFRRIQQMTKDHKGGWLPLSDLLSHYEPDRGFTWWTTRPFENVTNALELFQQANHMGIPNDWIDQYSVVMRIDWASLSPAHQRNLPTVWIPSVVDALLSPIFRATIQDQSPNRGEAINLQNPSQPGADEYVIRGNLLPFLQIRLIEAPLLLRKHVTVKMCNVSNKLYQEILKYH